MLSIAKETRAQNRRCLAKIIESLQYLSRQGLAIRGDNDEESNFFQLLKLRAMDDWLHKKVPKNTSHDVQNEIISLLATHTIRKLVSEIRNNYYSLICDEYTDISNIEQLTLAFVGPMTISKLTKTLLGFTRFSTLELKP